MALRLHIERPPPDPHFDALLSRLPRGTQVTTGSSPPEPASFEMLVAGVPSEELLDASPNLRALVIPYAGVPAITRERLQERSHVAVHNLHHNAIPTAEMAIGLLLAAAKRIVPCDRHLRSGDWTPRYSRVPSRLLHGQTALILGFGAIGQRIAGACVALGMHCVAISRTRRSNEDRNATEPGTEHHTVDRLADVLPLAQTIFVAVPLTPDTTGMLGSRELGLLQPGCILVNVARGPVVDEEALFEALAAGRVGAAGLDVWWRYPEADARHNTLPSALPFHQLDNVVMSPHRAGTTDRTEELRIEHLSRILEAAARGEPIPNRVDLAAGY